MKNIGLKWHSLTLAYSQGALVPLCDKFSIFQVDLQYSKSTISRIVSGTKRPAVLKLGGGVVSG
jgi:hypothetical protein